MPEHLPQSYFDNDPRRCGFELPDGSRCIAYKMNGKTACFFHGGATPRAKRSTKKSLELLRDISMERAYEILTESTDEKFVAKVVFAVLDRTGHGPRSTVSIEEQREDLASLSSDELRARIDALRQRAQQIVTRDDRAQAPGVH